MALRDMIPRRRNDEIRGAQEQSPFYSLQREMNRMFDRFVRDFGDEGLLEEREWGRFMPSVDVSETEKEIHVTAEIPGMDEKDLDVTLSGNRLLIRGEKKEEKEEKDEQFVRLESSFGSFQRAIPLPAEIDEDKIQASYDKGVLKISLPKSPEAQKAQKKIEIH